MQTCLVQFMIISFNSNLQVVPLTAAVIVTTPQKLAFIDVAKGVRMFSKLKVCGTCDMIQISFLYAFLTTSLYAFRFHVLRLLKTCVTLMQTGKDFTHLVEDQDHR